MEKGDLAPVALHDPAHGLGREKLYIHGSYTPHGNRRLVLLMTTKSYTTHGNRHMVLPKTCKSAWYPRGTDLVCYASVRGLSLLAPILGGKHEHDIASYPSGDKKR